MLATLRFILPALIFICFPFSMLHAMAQTGPETGKHIERVYGASEFKLDNGLHIVVIPNDRVPVVTHMIWYKAGAADEPLGQSGIAHFMEHLMFKGSGNETFGVIKPGEFSKIVRNLGGNDNAFTSQDYTAYFQSIAAEHLETVMRMEAGRMQSFHPSKDEVDAEREVILEERRQRVDNNPDAQLSEKLFHALYPNHPYGTPVIGWMHEMKALSHQNALDFHEKHYAPNNAILVISGDITPKEAKELAQKTYGLIPPRTLLKDARPKIAHLPGQTMVTLEDPSVKQPAVQIAFRAPSYTQNSAESLALSVFENYFSAGSTSPLYKSLVIDQKLASSAGASYSNWTKDDTAFWLYALPLPGVSVEQIEDALHKEIQKFLENGITSEGQKETVKRMQYQAIYARDSLTGPAMTIGRELTLGIPLDDIETWPSKIELVSNQDILEAVKKYLSKNNDETTFVTGILRPKENEAKE